MKLLFLKALFPAFLIWISVSDAGEAGPITVRTMIGSVRIDLCTDKIIRVRFDPSGHFDEPLSLIIAGTWKEVPYALRTQQSAIEIRTSSCFVRIDTTSGAVSFSRPDGQLLFSEDPKDPKSLVNANVLGEETHHALLNLKLFGGEGIYGLGQHQDGVMNYRGHTVTLTQTNTTVAIPFFISSRKYGVLFDNCSKIVFRDNDEGTSFWFEVADVIDYYVIVGSDMDDVIRGYREATGQAPMPGKWALGYWQSKERYRTGEELTRVAQEFRSRKIPIDNIVQDWLYWGEDPDFWNSFRFDPVRYPDAELMIRRLHEQYRLHLMVSIWPALGLRTDAYAEMEKKGFLFAPEHWSGGRTYDAYSREARSIYWRYVNEGLFSRGVDAFWMDATEPEVVLAPGEWSTKQAQKNALGTMARYLNPYSLLATSAVYDGQRDVDSRKRVCIVTRSAFPGQQRYSATTWSGDIIADWSVFRSQISAGLNFCMSGLPYWSNDIGGFHVRRYGGFPEGCTNDGYKELYVRWFQFGAFCPVFRSHGTDTPREPWQFGEPGSWAYDAILKYDHLRYRLLPYIYSLAWKVTRDGSTIMRGLPMDFPDDPGARSIDDQFMFGPSLLVNPVTRHMYHGEDYVNDLIPSTNLLTDKGKAGGFTAASFNCNGFDTLVVSETKEVPLLDLYTGFDLPPGVDMYDFSLIWTGFVRSNGAGEYELWLTSDDAVRFWFNGRLMVDKWETPGRDSTYRLKVDLSASRNYPFRIELARKVNATKLRLAWRTPEMRRTKVREGETGNRSVYLPGERPWYDFWTGEKVSGGKAITRETPIVVMPLYVRAGSILPLGPFLQYSSEKPADPIELRIYPGADAEFELYEDENDGYNYEKGTYSVTPLQWNEERQSLIIGDRKGEFPGMLNRRRFNIVWVREGKGVGEGFSDSVDAIVEYVGKAMKVDRKR